MPVWAWIVIAIAVVAAIAIAAVVGSLIWRRISTRYLRDLIGTSEEANAVRRAFDDLVGGLQRGSEEQRAKFADDPEAVERQSLADLHERARRIAEELNTMPLPTKFIPVAEAFADASDILAEEAERAGEGTIGDESLESLRMTDLNRVSQAFAYADAKVKALAEQYGIADEDVYGKGLYI